MCEVCSIFYCGLRNPLLRPGGARRQIAHVIEENVGVCRWVGLAVLLVQVACMGLAYVLSSAQQRLLLDASMCAPGCRVWGHGTSPNTCKQ